MSERICSIEGCERLHYARGWCHQHYQKWLRRGDPLWQRPTPGNSGQHWRVRRAKGKASSHPCVDCGMPADDWSYVNGCPDELSSDHGPFCLHLEHYDPRCRSCHWTYDQVG